MEKNNDIDISELERIYRELGLDDPKKRELLSRHLIGIPSHLTDIGEMIRQRGGSQNDSNKKQHSYTRAEIAEIRQACAAEGAELFAFDLIEQGLTPSQARQRVREISARIAREEKSQKNNKPASATDHLHRPSTTFRHSKR